MVRHPLPFYHHTKHQRTSAHFQHPISYTPLPCTPLQASSTGAAGCSRRTPLLLGTQSPSRPPLALWTRFGRCLARCWLEFWWWLSPQLPSCSPCRQALRVCMVPPQWGRTEERRTPLVLSSMHLSWRCGLLVVELCACSLVSCADVRRSVSVGWLRSTAATGTMWE